MTSTVGRSQVRRVTRGLPISTAYTFSMWARTRWRARARCALRPLQRPILIVTDDKRGLDAGGVINFIETERNVRFEISLLAADRARLKINSALLSVAARVERRPQASSGCADPSCAQPPAAADQDWRRSQAGVMR